MRKVHVEIFFSAVFVATSTILVYGYLSEFPKFFDKQEIWNVVLVIGFLIVSLGYFHQGYLVHHNKMANDVSLFLPSAVFIVQCVLFVKGIYYDDWSLVVGAVTVNSGVVFSIYNIFKAKFR